MLAPAGQFELAGSRDCNTVERRRRARHADDDDRRADAARRSQSCFASAVSTIIGRGAGAVNQCGERCAGAGPRVQTADTYAVDHRAKWRVGLKDSSRQ